MIIKLYCWMKFLTSIIFIMKDLTLAEMVEVTVNIPFAIQSGRNAILTCDYELGNDMLYSVKWYKGKREFFRFTPKEIPSIKVFSLPGINVDVESSNSTRIVLNKVEPRISGKYTCEVSADAPSFQTHIASGELQVVEFPENFPIIGNTKQSYSIGEIIETNCTSNSSIPPAKLEWRVNDVPVYDSAYIKKYKTIVDSETNRQTSILGLSLPLNNEHFFRGKLKLQCIARIYDIYEKDVTKYIEEFLPQILANSEVHFSFISARDAAGKSEASNLQFVRLDVMILLVIQLLMMLTMC